MIPTFEQSALLLAWVAIVILAFAMSGLLRQLHALREVVEGTPAMATPSIGDVVPRIPQLDGKDRAFLLFADPSCPTCDESLQRLASKAAATSQNVAYAVLYRGDGKEHTFDQVTTIRNADDIFAKLGITVTPTAVVLNSERQVLASAPVGSPELIDQFSDYAVRGQEDDNDHHR